MRGLKLLTTKGIMMILVPVVVEVVDMSISAATVAAAAAAALRRPSTASLHLQRSIALDIKTT